MKAVSQGTGRPRVSRSQLPFAAPGRQAQVNLVKTLNTALRAGTSDKALRHQ